MPSSFSPDEVVSSIFKKFEGEWLTPEFIRDESNRLCDALSAAHIGDPGRTAREFQSQGIVQKDKEKATAFQYDSANSDKPFKPMQNLYDSEDFNQETYELLKYLDDLRRQISKEHGLQKVKQILNWKSPLSKQELPPDLFAELSTQKPSQVIFYGVPGSGKSHFIHDKLRDCDKSQILRTVFHPEYTNADFVGQIRPEVDDGGNARYKFHPGPFPRILERAFKNPGEHFYLVIEEINRGNAAAIFGDIFQLFDRDDSGESRYPIWNEDIAQTVFRDAGEPIRHRDHEHFRPKRLLLGQRLLAQVRPGDDSKRNSESRGFRRMRIPLRRNSKAGGGVYRKHKRPLANLLGTHQRKNPPIQPRNSEFRGQANGALVRQKSKRQNFPKDLFK